MLESTTSMTEVPEELLDYLLFFLKNPHDLLQIGTTCQQFHRLSQNNHYWITYLDQCSFPIAPMCTEITYAFRFQSEYNLCIKIMEQLGYSIAKPLLIASLQGDVSKIQSSGLETSTIQLLCILSAAKGHQQAEKELNDSSQGILKEINNKGSDPSATIDLLKTICTKMNENRQQHGRVLRTNHETIDYLWCLSPIGSYNNTQNGPPQSTNHSYR